MRDARRMGFSFASVFLSYFLVAGGTFLTTLVAARLGVHNEYLGYIIMAVGGAIGGFFAARASKGSTILEPALGAALVVVSLFGIGVAMSSGEARSAMLLPGTMKALALTSAASAGGGIVGAFVSEKMFGESSTSSTPWLVYVSLAAFGAGVIGTIFTGFINKGGGVYAAMLAACTLVVGIASGASAQSRPLGPAFLGGLIGIGAYLYLSVLIMVALFGGMGGKGDAGIPNEAYAGMAIIAGGAGIVTTIGAAIGWATVGSKQAAAKK
jgi:hypothetical protein